MTLKPQAIRVAITLAFMLGGTIAYATITFTSALLHTVAGGMSPHAHNLITGTAAAAVTGLVGWFGTGRLTRGAARLTARSQREGS